MKFLTIFLRTVIIGFWFICLILFLAMPAVTNLWQDDKTINLFIWGATIDPKIIDDFQKETGIRVNQVYFESNEELFVKLLTAKGRGYDLLMPSDYVVEKLIAHKLIKPLDKTKLDFWDSINPRLLNHYFDPGNIYTIPYFWAIYGLGISNNFFGKKVPPSSWQLLFDYPITPAKVAMLNVARESILITAQYLYESIENITTNKIDEIKKKLIAQKKRVEVYTDADIRANYLLASETCPVVVAASPYMAQLMQEDDSVSFLFPKEGSFILIDSLVISSKTDKEALVYKFINYLFRPEILLHHFESYPFLPVTKNLKSLMEKNNTPKSIIDAHFDESLKLEFFKNVISEEIVNTVWMLLKTS